MDEDGRAVRRDKEIEMDFVPVLVPEQSEGCCRFIHCLQKARPKWVSVWVNTNQVQVSARMVMPQGTPLPFPEEPEY